MSSHLQERIANLLVSGIRPSQISSIVGVTPSRISQITSEESFKELLKAKEASLQQENIEQVNLEAKYHATEHLLLNQLQESLPGAEIRDLIAGIRALNERHSKKVAAVNPTPLGGGQVLIQNVIQLSVPAHALPLPAVEVTENNEVISVGEQTLAPLSSQGVTNLFQTLRNRPKLEATA